MVCYIRDKVFTLLKGTTLKREHGKEDKKFTFINVGFGVPSTIFLQEIFRINSMWGVVDILIR